MSNNVFNNLEGKSNIVLLKMSNEYSNGTD